VISRDLGIRLARQAVRLPVEDRAVIVDALLLSGQIPDAGDRRHLNAERYAMIRAYRGEWHPNLGVNDSLFVVGHELDIVRHADWIADVGPGAGEQGRDTRQRPSFGPRGNTDILRVISLAIGPNSNACF
jgi:hypothetical protein